MESKSSAIIKFGIVGCANIARKVSRAIILSPNSSLYAIGSRSLDKAAKFAKDNGIPDSTILYGSYDAVLEDPAVDAVYIPLPTSLHLKWAVLAAQKKKHVLLEKPVALNVGELDVILEVCQSSGVQIMDSTMWMHHPRTAKMKDFLLDSSLFGKLQFVHSCLCFAANEDFLENNIRVKPDLDGLGTLGDQGWYCIRSILWAADYEMPKSVAAFPTTAINSAGVIISCGASLNWEDGKTATFNCSFLANLTISMTAVGSNGTLHLEDYVLPFEEKEATFFTSVKPGFKDGYRAWGPKPSEHVVGTEVAQEVLMVTEFSRLVGNIKCNGGEAEKKWPMISRMTQIVVDAVKLSIDNGYKIVEVTS